MHVAGTVLRATVEQGARVVLAPSRFKATWRIEASSGYADGGRRFVVPSPLGGVIDKWAAATGTVRVRDTGETDWLVLGI